MNYIRTGRKFTYAVRTEDAYARTGGVTQNSLGETTMTWPVNWKNIMPTDIAPNSTFICTHRFEEGTGGTGIPRDTVNYVRRGFNIFCNLPSYAAASDYNVNVPGDVLGTVLNTPDGAKRGFINMMTERNLAYFLANNAYGNGHPLVVYYFAGIYFCPSQEFEVFSPENHASISITYGEVSNPLTLAQIQASVLYGVNTPFVTYPGGQVLPQFQYVDSNQVIQADALLGTHIFEFELVAKVPSRNHV